MPQRFQAFAVVLAMSLAAFAAGSGAASGESGQTYESCLTARALALELTGVEVDEVIAQAERACSEAKGGLTNAVAGEVSHKVRLAVIQQRSNARNTRRRG